VPVSALPRFICLYAALFAALGAASPFLPALLQERGLDPSAIGLVLGLGSAIRLAAGPLGGRLADRSGAPRAVLAAGLAATAVVALGYAPARGLLPLALVSVGHAALLAPLTPLADTLALGAGDRPGGRKSGGFEYGWVRGAGSAAFILGNVTAGMAVGWAGLDVIIWINASLLAVSAVLATRVPNRTAGVPMLRPERSGRVRDLLRIPMFTRLMLVAALVGGSHALHDGFEVIRWQAAGMGPGAAGILWGESVAAEVVVFFVLGPLIIERLGPGGAAMLAAAAGVVRWGTAAQTAAVPAMALVEPLHGFTFALMHLTCVRMIARTVPVQLSATAQAFYGTVAVGTASTALTFASGPLYSWLGASAFWVMAALCAAALPISYGLRGSPDPLPARGAAGGT
jgi:PPP family 3-phenylpropionic acid transporter